MKEFLQLCGFEEAEIEAQLPRVKKAFEKTGITQQDLTAGEQRMRQYYDIKLVGVRKIFRLCLLEMVDTVLARDERKEKIIFGLMSPGFETIGTALMAESKDVFAAHLAYAFLLINGCIFDKTSPVFETAENLWLKAGAVCHCSNVKTFLGLIASGLVPVPDIMVSAGFTCETAPKTLDLMHELYGIAIHCIDTCQDRSYQSYGEDSLRTVTLAARSLKKQCDYIQKELELEIQKTKVEEILDLKDQYNDHFSKVMELIASSDPLPLSPTHFTLLFTMGALTMSTERMKEAIEALHILHEELQERVAKGEGVLEKGAPRLLGILPCHHSDPRYEHTLNNMGIAFAGIDLGLGVPYPVKPEDPYEAMSMHLQQSLATSPARRIPLLMEACRQLRVDGVLNRAHVGCRSVLGDSLIIAEALEKEMGLPVLTLEWENFDSRVYNHEEYTRKLEIFREILLNRKRSGQ